VHGLKPATLLMLPNMTLNADNSAVYLCIDFLCHIASPRSLNDSRCLISNLSFTPQIAPKHIGPPCLLYDCNSILLLDEYSTHFSHPQQFLNFHHPVQLLLVFLVKKICSKTLLDEYDCTP